MSQHGQPISLEERVDRLEALVQSLLGGNARPEQPAGVDVATYQRAIRRARQGDKSLLMEYLKRGGKVPMEGRS